VGCKASKKEDFRELAASSFKAALGTTLMMKAKSSSAKLVFIHGSI
jgi:hypothetical protein